jgi:hypothetical protein
MESAPPVAILDIVTDFLATNPTPEENIAFRFSAELEKHLHELLDRNGEGELTPVEREELNNIVRADTMMSLHKAKTRLKLRDSKT